MSRSATSEMDDTMIRSLVMFSLVSIERKNAGGLVVSTVDGKGSAAREPIEPDVSWYAVLTLPGSFVGVSFL